MPSTRSLFSLAAAAAAAILTACGSGDETPSPQPTPDMPFTIDRPFLTALPVGYRIETLLDGLNQPAAIAATPDGRLLVAEQVTGRVRVIKDGLLLDDPWMEIRAYFKSDEFLQELGLVGVAVDPEFEQNHFVYVYYSGHDENGERQTVFARAVDDGERGSGLMPLVTIDLAPSKTHIAGGIAFDNAGAILIGIGDHERGDLPRRLDSPAGKILRIDRDGNALPDNPFAGEPGADPRVYVSGVRNPFGIAVDPQTGRAYFADNREVTGDALYELEPGADYGWPDHQIALREPLILYDQPLGMAAVTVYRGQALPDFDGGLFFCTFNMGGGLHWSEPGDLSGLDYARRDRLIAPGCGTGVTVGADGFLYFLSYDGRLMRISR